MSNYTVHRDVYLSTMECPKCTGLYAISQRFLDESKKLGNFMHCWTCPYCKEERGYGKGEADKLREELSEAKSKLTRAKCEASVELNRRIVVEAELKRHKTRARNGVCPCCHRSFQNLKRHIKTKHPEFPVNGKNKK